MTIDKPTRTEAVEFGDAYGIPEMVVRGWYDYSDSKDWTVGGVPIRNWQGALLSWNGRRLRTINLNRRGRNGK